MGKRKPAKPGRVTSRRAQQPIRERFEDVLFLIERDEGMAGVYAVAQALAERCTEEMLQQLMQELGWGPRWEPEPCPSVEP